MHIIFSALGPQASSKVKVPCHPVWSWSLSRATLTLANLLTGELQKGSHLLLTTVRSFPSASTVSSSPHKMSATEDSESNPLLEDFDFPPFDRIEAKHVRPGVRALLKQLVCY